MDGVEYVGHDLTPNGNCPAKSKFHLIHDWPLPANGLNLHSFLGLCSFYSCFCPWFEIDVTPLWALIHKYKCKPIPDSEWTDTNKNIFHKLKQSLSSSPCLAWYDSTQPCFLETDWSVTGMGFVLMQIDNNDLSTNLIKHWSEISVGKLKVNLNGACL